jgi:hypothetical protein
MAYTTTLSEGNQFIEVQYTGRVSTSQVYDALAARSGLAHQYDIKDHLIECSQVVNLPAVTDLYSIAPRIREILDYPIYKAALVLPISIPLATNILYFIIKAHQCGVNIEMFKNRQDAVRWLSGAGDRLAS